MENKFGLDIEYDPTDSVNFLEDIGILKKTKEGNELLYFACSVYLRHSQ